MAGRGVDFKANANGLVVVFDKDEAFDAIYAQIAAKLESGGFFFQTRYLAISYRGRQLTSGEESLISHMMSEKTGARTVLFEFDKDFQRDSDDRRRDPTGAKNGGNVGRRNPQSGTGQKNTADDGAETRPATESAASRYYTRPDPDECVTKYYRGTLRSGRLVSYDGNVVVVGDVNPGAEVEATGSVIVLGAVKGIVHAGAGGYRDATIIALNFDPTQLRIADIVTSGFNRRGGIKNIYKPEIALIKFDKIVFEPLNRQVDPSAQPPVK